jgi:hypothetical protein
VVVRLGINWDDGTVTLSVDEWKHIVHLVKTYQQYLEGECRSEVLDAAEDAVFNNRLGIFDQAWVVEGEYRVLGQEVLHIVK